MWKLQKQWIKMETFLKIFQECSNFLVYQK